MKFELNGLFSILDYAYKGDDDTIVIPRNLAYQIRNMKAGTSAIGNVRWHDPVARNIEIKYYMPKEIIPYNNYYDYFSGAAYVMRGKFAFEVAKFRNSTQGNDQMSNKIQQTC